MRLGFDPEAYWRQTPRYMLAALEARQEARKSDARDALISDWRVAAFTGWRKPPDLAPMLRRFDGADAEDDEQSDDEIRANWAAWVAVTRAQTEH